jgi:hypothetical protein
MKIEYLPIFVSLLTYKLKHVSIIPTSFFSNFILNTIQKQKHQNKNKTHLTNQIRK